jgi:hypothetical protein
MLKFKTTPFFMLAACFFVTSLHASAVTIARVVDPSNDVPVPASLREKLGQCENVRAFVALRNGDDIVVFNTVRDKPNSTDFMNNHPRLALFHGGSRAFDLDAVNVAPSGPVRFHGMVVSPQANDSIAVIAAFTLGVNSAETFFVFVGHDSKGYGVVAMLSGGQAQLRFNEELSGSFELWAADGQAAHEIENQCVWCRKYYEATTYQFENGKLRKLSAWKSKQAYEPEAFYQKPFALSSGNLGRVPTP